MAESKHVVSRIDPDTLPGALYAVRRAGLWLGRSDGPAHIVNVMMVKALPSLEESADYSVHQFAITFDSKRAPEVTVESFLLLPTQESVSAHRSRFVEPYLQELDRMYDSVVRALQHGKLQARYPPVSSRDALFAGITFSEGHLINS